MNFHPLSEIFPLLSGSEFDALVDDIRQHGVQDAIWLYEDSILDGRNRWRASEVAGINCPTRDYTGADPLGFVISLNLKRRHLTASQLGFVALAIEEIEAKEAKERMIEGKNQYSPVELFPQGSNGEAAKERQGTRTDIGETIPRSETGKARDKAALLVGTNPHYVTDAKRIKAEAPELASEVIAGNKTIPEALRELKRTNVIENLNSIETKTAKAIEGVYDVIVIDPPWPMQKIDRNVAPNQTGFDYPIMTLEEITSLTIPAATNCHVWLWTTHRFLPDAFKILETWAMKYICAFVWHKPGGFQPFDLPQYNCEFALYARIGTPKFIDLKNFPTCFNAPRGAHSEKPAEFYEMVCRVTAGRRLDMFNRRPIDGFDVWGKEA